MDRPKKILYLLFLIFFILWGPLMAKAQEFKSDQYQIESGSFEFEPELKKNPEGFDLSASLGQTAQNKFREKGYAAISREDAEFSSPSHIQLQISRTQLIFKEAQIGEESKQVSTVKVLGDTATKFITAIHQETPFKNDFGATISATDCDSKNAPCTPIAGKKWVRSYGFGYRVQDTTQSDLRDEQSFRPLFVGNASAYSAIIYSGYVTKKGKALDLIFKLRPAPDVQTGIYKSTITISATADY